MSQVTDPGGESAVRKALSEILSDPRFAHLSKGDTQAGTEPVGDFFRSIQEFPPVIKIGSFLEKLLRPLNDLFSFLAVKLGEGDILWYAVTGLCIVLFVFVVLQICRSIRDSLVMGEKEIKDTRKPGFFSPTRYETEALNSAAALDYRTAIQNMYLLMLLNLEKRNAMDYSRASTNREIEEKLAVIARKDLLRAFHCCTVIFEETIYAGRAVDTSLFAEFSSHYETFTRTF